MLTPESFSSGFPHHGLTEVACVWQAYLTESTLLFILRSATRLTRPTNISTLVALATRQQHIAIISRPPIINAVEALSAHGPSGSEARASVAAPSYRF